MSPGRPDELVENDCVHRGEKASPQGENDHVPRGEKSSPLGENNCLSRREKSSLPTDVKSDKSVKYLLEFIFLSQSLMYSRKAYDSELLNRNSGQKVKRVFCLHMLIG